MDGRAGPGPWADDTTSRWLLWLVAGLAFGLVGAVLVTAAGAESVGPDRRVAELMLQLVDEERAAHDLPPLVAAADVTAVAERWSARMAELGSMEHNPSFAQEICCWAVVTENVAYGEGYALWVPGDPVERIMRELHAGLLSSPGHRANLLDPGVDQIGIAVHVDAEGSVWITQNFRRHRSP